MAGKSMSLRQMVERQERKMAEIDANTRKRDRLVVLHTQMQVIMTKLQATMDELELVTAEIQEISGFHG